MSPGTRWPYRVDATRWDSVRDDLDAYGCALTGSLLTPGEAAGIAALYQDDSRFRSTIDMGRYRFGEGESVKSRRGWSAAPVRHGVSVIRSGQRFTLGLVFHDAA
jgi:hypothetical protein